MIKKWYSSIAIDLARMTDVTDEMIRENSNGVVNKMLPDEEDLGEGEESDYENTLEDVKIFGFFGEENPDKMGHIELPIPVVNVQYTKGKCPELQRVLGLSIAELDRLIYDFYSVRKEDDWNNGIPLYSYDEKEADQLESTFLSGADAVEAILRFKGIDPSRYILNVLPVMPICMRNIKKWDNSNLEEDPVYISTSLNANYEHMIHRSNRVKRILSLPDVPSIIIANEKKILQHGVDQLICNGIGGVPVLQRRGTPFQSLDDLYDIVTEVVVPKKSTEPGFVDSLEDICRPEEVKKLWEIYENSAYEVSFDKDGYKDLTNKAFETEDEEKEVDAYFEDLITYLSPLIKKIHDERYAQYTYNGKKIPEITRELIHGALEYWEPEKETAVKRLVGPILASFDYHYRKRAMWEDSSGKEEA